MAEIVRGEVLDTGKPGEDQHPVVVKGRVRAQPCFPRVHPLQRTRETSEARLTYPAIGSPTGP